MLQLTYIGEILFCKIGLKTSNEVIVLLFIFFVMGVHEATTVATTLLYLITFLK